MHYVFRKKKGSYTRWKANCAIALFFDEMHDRQVSSRLPLTQSA